MSNQRVTIGEAATCSGLTAKAIRLYERRGLLGVPGRTPAGYRTYGSDELAVLAFIRQAKNVGLRLDEIGHVLDLGRSGEQPCDAVLALLDERIADIDRTIANLRALRRTMTVARARSTEADQSGRPGLICNLIEGSRRHAGSPRTIDPEHFAKSVAYFTQCGTCA